MPTDGADRRATYAFGERVSSRGGGRDGGSVWDWSALVVRCRSSKETRGMLMGSRKAKDSTLRRILGGLKHEESWPEREYILLFLEEFSSELLETAEEEMVEQVLGGLHEVLLDLPCSTAESVHFLSQLMVCMTSVYILLEQVRVQPARVESFVNYLFEILQGAQTSLESSQGSVSGDRGASGAENRASAMVGGGLLGVDGLAAGNIAQSMSVLGKDLERGIAEVVAKTGYNWGGASSRAAERELRRTAAECLRELEDAYPGLLECNLQPLMDLCHSEATHAVQAYQGLFSSTFYNCCLRTVQQYHTYCTKEREDEEEGDEGSGREFGYVSDSPDLYSGTPEAADASYTTASLAVSMDQVAADATDTKGKSGSDLPSTFFQGNQSLKLVISETSLGSHLYGQLYVLPRIMARMYESVEMGPDGMNINRAVSYFPARLKKELRTCLAHFVDALPSLTRWGVADTVSKLLRLIIMCDMPEDLLAGHIQRLLHTYSIDLLHIVVTLALDGGDSLSGAGDSLMLRLVALANSPGLPDEHRLLATRWVGEIMTANDERGGRVVPAGIIQLLQPSVLDPFLLRVEKGLTLLLYRRYSKVSTTHSRGLLSASTHGTQGLSGEQGGGRGAVGPVEALKTMASFRYHPSHHRAPRAVLRIIVELFRQHADGEANLTDEEGVRTVISLLREVLAECPHLQGLIIDLHHDVQLPYSCRLLLVTAVQEELLRLPPAALRFYLPVARMLMESEAPVIDKTALVAALEAMVALESLCEAGDWVTGDMLLGVVKCLLQSPSSSSHRSDWFTHLHNLLQACAQRWGDLEIRDRAEFYLQLVTHAPQDIIRGILATSVQEETAAKVSSVAPSWADSQKLLAVAEEVEPAFSVSLLRTSSSVFEAKNCQGGSGISEEGRSFLSDLEDSEVSLEVSLMLEVRLAEAAAEEAEGRFVSLMLALSPDEKTSSVYRQVCDVSVPSLGAEGAGKQEIAVTLRPLLPAPTGLNLTSTYTDITLPKDYKAHHPALKVSFKDLLCRIPLDSDRGAFFHAAWSRLASIEGEASAKELQDMIVVKTIHAKRSHAEAALRSHLGTALPARYLLLLRFTMGADMTGVEIRTDCWMALRHVDGLLEEIFS